jgi:lactoylglutathione lyase
MNDLPKPHSLFESHLVVSDLSRSILFYSSLLHARPAAEFPGRRLAFFWIGCQPGQSMLGLWESPHRPKELPSRHTAFTVTLPELLETPAKLRAAGIEPLGFDGRPTNQPDVLAWMPAAAVYFEDPDGNLLEYLTMLNQPPRPGLGILKWDEWQRE